MAAVMILLLVALLTFYAAVHLGHRMAGLPPAPRGLGETLAGVLDGSVAWPAASTFVVAGLAAAVLAIAAFIASVWRRRTKGRSRVDRSARQMGLRADIETITLDYAQGKARALGADPAFPGVTLGQTISGRVPLSSSPEDVGLLIAGPRTMKTTCYGIPALVDAPGAAFATGNKRDIVDATRSLRAAKGHLWIFDPQRLVGQEPTWWWNPLSYVTDQTHAIRLASVFASFDADPGAKADAHFENTSRSVLAALLLAAARDRRPITDVFNWATTPSSPEPVQILEKHGDLMQARVVLRVQQASDKEKSGYYSTLTRITQILTNPELWPWIVDDGHRRPHFDPAAFVETSDTLYLLSQEEEGNNAGPIVTALTVAVLEAAQAKARVSPLGRLPVHLTGVLDEAANVCKWKKLPDLYSFFGSQGIVLLTILQSYSQGVHVWGEAGMSKLWSAANFVIYGGGVRETKWLEDVSKLIGHWDRPTKSVTVSDGRRSTQYGTSRQRILDVDDLGALPRRRAVVLASGSRPTLIRTKAWQERPDADAIAASIAQHDPNAGRTLAEAQRILAEERAAEERELA